MSEEEKKRILLYHHFHFGKWLLEKFNPYTSQQDRREISVGDESKLNELLESGFKLLPIPGGEKKTVPEVNELPDISNN